MCGPLQGPQAHRPPWGEGASPGPRAQRKRVRVWRGASREPRSALPGPFRGSGAGAGVRAPPRAGSSLASPPARSASRSAPPATAWLAAGPGTRGDPRAAAPPASRPQTPPPTARSYQPRASGKTAAAPSTAAGAEGGLCWRPGGRRAERGRACGLRPRRGAGRRGGSSPGRAGGDRGGPSQAQRPSAQHRPRAHSLPGPPSLAHPHPAWAPRYQSAPLSSAPRTPSSTASVLTPTPHTPPPAPPGPQAPSSLTPSPVPLSLRFPGVCPHGLLTAGRRGEDGAPGRQGARASQAQSSTGPRRPPSRRERGAGTPLPASRAAAQVPPGPAGGLATCNPTAPASGPPGPRRTGPLGLAPSCFPRFVCPRVSSRPPANPRL